MEGFITDNRGWCEVDEEGNKSIKIESDSAEAGTQYQCVLIKRDDNYMKRLLTGQLELTAQVCQNLSKNKKDYNSKLSEQNINIEDFVHLLNTLGRFTGMLINSSSWRDQELHDYDKIELRTRLEKLLYHLK